MSKTIEEAANEYASNCGAKHNIYNPELYAVITSAYKTGASHVLSLPLSQRLTDEEREMVKSIRLKFYDKWLNHQDECNEAVYCAVKSMLESIFGKELFGEGEGC